MAEKEGYVGIDYGLGRSNIDNETGIRYGVISQHSLDGDALGDLEYDYGDPTCPECGGEICGDLPDDISDDLRGYDFVCLKCMKGFDSDGGVYPEEAIGFHYNQDGYKLVDCLDTDIMVLESPFYTFAQFCSPCVPGAGNLDNPMTNGVKCYALGHDWFESKIAPYPVYRVKDDVQIVASREIVDCAWCKGTGKRVIEHLINTMPDVKIGDIVKCWVCDGTGKMNEVIEKEVK